MARKRRKAVVKTKPIEQQVPPVVTLSCGCTVQAWPTFFMPTLEGRKGERWWHCGDWRKRATAKKAA
jgi:hypothetical protein